MLTYAGSWSLLALTAFERDVGTTAEALRQQERSGTSLAAFRPADGMEVVVEANDEWDEGQRTHAAQGSLLMPDKEPLEWIPLRFKYRYECQNEADCGGHSQSVVDWGVLELYRKSARHHGPTKARRDVVTKLEELAGPIKDTILLVGNQHQAPRAFMVIGVAYPSRVPSERHSEQLRLDLL